MQVVCNADPGLIPPGFLILGVSFQWEFITLNPQAPERSTSRTRPGLAKARDRRAWTNAS